MDIEQYVGRPMISWLWYNPNYEERFGNTNIVCYIYPRVLVSTSLEIINAEEDFPENGRIEVFIQGGQSAKEVFEQFGALVSVRLNRELSPNYKGYNRYRVNYQPQTSNHGHTSDVVIERLSGRKFYQVIETESSFSVLQSSRVLERTQQPFLDYVLIKTGDSLYGPFEYSYSNDRLLLKSAKFLQYQVGEYSWNDYANKTTLITDQEKNPVMSILPASDLLEPQKSYDWISDEQLVLELISVLKASSQYTRSQLRKIGETSEALLKCNADKSLTDERRQRLQTLVQNLAAWSDLADSIVKTALEDDSMCEVLADIAISAHLEEIKESLLKHEGIREHIAELRHEEYELQQNVEKLQQTEADLQSRVSVMKEMWETDPVVLERKMALEEYERKIQEARIQYNYERIQQEKLSESLTLLLQQYRDKAGQITRLFDKKIIADLLYDSSADSIATVTADAEPELAQFNPALLHAPMSQEEIVDRVLGYFRDKAGRKVSRNDIINYLICISQGFITTFAGKSGIGKTTLCKILANSMGLATADGQTRYIEIPVERNWTSYQDFIASYNPITKTMDVKNTDLWEAFARLDQECNSSSDSYAPFFMLFDEATASPIDSYLSVFLRSCDIKSSTNKVISIDRKKSWKIPRHLRFLATVNFNHMSAKLPLSFLERSWIIMLDLPEIAEDAEDDFDNYSNMVPFSSFYSAFGFSSSTGEMDKLLVDKWNAIRAIFQKHHLPIMPRNLKMVRNYCSTACKCMERDIPETQLAPLDYSFSQKILPTINGSGENYRDLVYDLRRECMEKEMPLSAQHLERMQRIADNSKGAYCFFDIDSSSY